MWFSMWQCWTMGVWYVVRERVVQERRAFPHRFLRIQHERQLLVFGPEQGERALCGDVVLRDHAGDVVPVVPDVPVEKMPVRNVLMGRVRRPGMAGGRKRDIRHVEAGQDLHDAGDRGGFRGVQFLHEAVRSGRMQDVRDQRVPPDEILRISGAAGHLVEGVDASDVLSNAHWNLPWRIRMRSCRKTPFCPR